MRKVSCKLHVPVNPDREPAMLDCTANGVTMNTSHAGDMCVDLTQEERINLAIGLLYYADVCTIAKMLGEERGCALIQVFCKPSGSETGR